jgi:hypothetical protein
MCGAANRAECGAAARMRVGRYRAYWSGKHD